MKNLNLKNIVSTGLFTIFATTLLFAQETYTSNAEEVNLSKYKSYDWIETKKSTSANNKMYESGKSADKQMNSSMKKADKQMSSTETTADKKMDKARKSADNQMSQMSNTSDDEMNSTWKSDSKYSDLSSKKEVKKAIETQMEARGFSHDPNDPDMLISFQVLDEPTELRTFTSEAGQSYLGYGPRSGNSTMVPVEPGTVIINFIDAQTGSHVWQGFSSGAFEVEDMADISNLDAKVIAIFNEWNFDPFGGGQ